jgi:hypothetical protein
VRVVKLAHEVGEAAFEVGLHGADYGTGLARLYAQFTGHLL